MNKSKKVIFKHECIKCKYSTNLISNYNKHIKTIAHYEKNNICNKCYKNFRDKYNLNRHLQRLNSCIQNDVPILINNSNQNNQSININIDNSINITDNSNNINFNPTDYKGNKFKFLRNLQLDETLSFLHPDNIKLIEDNILKLLNHENFNEIAENKITDDILNENDSELIKTKMSKMRSLYNKNNLLKDIQPDISSNKSHEYIFNKLRLFPQLLTIDEIDIYRENIEDFKERNNEIINLYYTNIFTNAVLNTNMDLEEPNKLCVLDFKNKICTKYNKKQLQKLSDETLNQIIEFRSNLDELINENINVHLCDPFKIKIIMSQFEQIVKEKFIQILDNYNK